MGRHKVEMDARKRNKMGWEGMGLDEIDRSEMGYNGLEWNETECAMGWAERICYRKEEIERAVMQCGALQCVHRL